MLQLVDLLQRDKYDFVRQGTVCDFFKQRFAAFSVSFFGSLTPAMGSSGFRMTAAQQTGPHSGPRPASSTPQSTPCSARLAGVKGVERLVTARRRPSRPGHRRSPLPRLLESHAGAGGSSGEPPHFAGAELTHQHLCGAFSVHLAAGNQLSRAWRRWPVAGHGRQFQRRRIQLVAAQSCLG